MAAGVTEESDVPGSPEVELADTPDAPDAALSVLSDTDGSDTAPAEEPVVPLSVSGSSPEEPDKDSLPQSSEPVPV